MYDMTNTTQQSLSLLDALAIQAKSYSEAVATNSLLLGKVLCEARELVPHGSWASWVQENTSMSERTAQNFMGIYKRFGNNAAFAGIDKTKLFRLMSLPEGQEEQFVQEHDVNTMTTRQVEEAVKKARDEERAKNRKAVEEAVEKARQEEQENARASLAALGDKLKQEQKDRQRAEQECKRVTQDETYIPKAVREQIEQLKTTTKNALENAKLANESRIKAENELDDRNIEVEELQKQYDDVQRKLLDIKSEISKGDAERTPSDTLTLDTFASAVRSFIGTCARMPYMDARFAGMELHELNGYDELLKTVQNWCVASRKAMRVEVIA